MADRSTISIPTQPADVSQTVHAEKQRLMCVRNTGSSILSQMDIKADTDDRVEYQIPGQEGHNVTKRGCELTSSVLQKTSPMALCRTDGQGRE